MTRFRTRLWYSPGIGYRATIIVYDPYTMHEFTCDTADERDARVRDIMNEHKQKEQTNA